MCINLKVAYLVSHPKRVYGNFIIKTRQYNEYVQYDKEYIIFGDTNKILLRFNDVHKIYIPCGKCLTCLNKRSRSWTLRLTTEYLKYDFNCILTLTYNDDNLPDGGLINYTDVKLFLKRLRKHLEPRKIRFACVSEYGSQKLRPHYHVIIYNYFPDDVNLNKPYKITDRNSYLYKSDFLTDLWGKGFVDVGNVNYRSSRYITQYCAKKAFHKDNLRFIEKNKLSREKLTVSIGTGFEYFLKNRKFIFDNSFCVLGNRKYPIPKYFKNKLKELFPQDFEVYKKKCYDMLKDFVLTPEVQRKFEAIEDRFRRMFKIFHNNNSNLLLT